MRLCNVIIHLTPLALLTTEYIHAFALQQITQRSLTDGDILIKSK